MSAAHSETALLDDEDVLHDVSPAWPRYWSYYLLGVFTIPLFFAGVGVIIMAWIANGQERVVVTDQRVLVTTWFFRAETTEYRLEDVEQISTSQSFVEEFADAGTIRIVARSGEQDHLTSLPNYQAVASTLRDCLAAGDVA